MKQTDGRKHLDCEKKLEDKIRQDTSECKEGVEIEDGHESEESDEITCKSGVPKFSTFPP